MINLISGQQWKHALEVQPPLVLLYHHLSLHLLNSYKSEFSFLMMIIIITVMRMMRMMMVVLLYVHLSPHLLNSYKSELLYLNPQQTNAKLAYMAKCTLIPRRTC